MKITITHYNQTHTWESDSDGHDLTEVIQQVKGLLVATGFHPENVDEYFSADTNTWFPYEPLVKPRSDWEDAYDSLNGYGSECPPGMIKAPKIDQGDHDCVPDGSYKTPIPEEVDFDGIKIMMSGVPKDKKT
jgi:hypothetical protein